MLADTCNVFGQLDLLLCILAFHHQKDMPPIAACPWKMRKMWSRPGLKHSLDPCPIKSSVEEPISYTCIYRSLKQVFMLNAMELLMGAGGMEDCHAESLDTADMCLVQSLDA